MAASDSALSLLPGTISLFSGTQAERSVDPTDGMVPDVISGRIAVSDTTAASCNSAGARRRRSFARARARLRCSHRLALPFSVARYTCPARQTSQRRFASRHSHEQNRSKG